jgi:uncharacterized protein
MLMTLGSVTFEVQPFNTHEYSHTHQTDYVDKPVVGARKPLEFVGDGDETWTISGRLFPKKLGGLNGLARLASARKSGVPQYLMRGDGRPMGFVAILSVTEKSTYLDVDGVGKIVEFEVTVKQAGAPGIAGFVSMFG